MSFVESNCDRDELFEVELRENGCLFLPCRDVLHVMLHACRDATFI